MNNFSKQASYKINNQKKKKSTEQGKNQKHLEKNLINKMKGLYNQNIKAWTKDVKYTAESEDSSHIIITLV